MRKQLATVGLAAALVAGGAGALAVAVPGISLAQDSTSSTTAPAQPDKGAERADKLGEALKPLVDNGTITQDQANAVIDALKNAAPKGGPGHGHGGPGLDTAAQALGMTADELHTALESGQTLAQIAQSKGVDVQKVIDAIVDDAKAHIQQEVTDGHLTQEQADAKIAELSQRAGDMVNGKMPAGPPMGGGRGHGPHGGPGAPGGSADNGSSGSGSGTTTPSSATGSSAHLRGV